ncbi:FAD-dependent oxidoreductase [Brucellaceae bacterium C25G]
MHHHRDRHYDVVVAGGGAAGMSAAVGAARLGAKVLLVERYGFLGGAAVNSLVLAYCGFFLKGAEQVFAVRGTGGDLLDTLHDIGQNVEPIKSANGNWVIMLDPEALKFGFDRMTNMDGLDVVFHSRVTASNKNTDGIASIMVTDHAGSYEVTAGAFVDASGEATLASLSADPMLVDSMAGDHVQPASMPVRIGGVPKDVQFDRTLMAQLIKEHNATSDNPIHRPEGGFIVRIPISNDFWWMTIDLVTNGLSGESLAAVEKQARAEAWRNLKILQKIPGFENAFIASTGPQIGIRESRRPRSLEDMTGFALETGMRREDGIARAAWPMEVHEAPGRARFIDLGGDGFADVPLNALRSAQSDNLFFAGRVTGAEPAAYGSLRVMGTAFATGHAAGVAAALRASGTLSVENVQKQLRAQNALI